MIDICQEGHSQRSAPQKRHTAHLRRHASCTPRKPSGRDGGSDKKHPPPVGYRNHQAPGHLSCSDLGRAQNAGPTESVPLWSTREPESERLRPGKFIQPRALLRQFQQSNPEPKQCRQGKHTPRERGQTQCGRDKVSTCQCYSLQCSSLPTAQLKK